MFEHNHIPELVQEILRGKALAQLVEAATVTDESGNPVELKNLLPDGTIGEPQAEDEAADGRRRRHDTEADTDGEPRRTPTSNPVGRSRSREHAPRGECTTVHRRPRLRDMAQVATPGPTVLDALSLLAEVGDELRRPDRARHPPGRARPDLGRAGPPGIATAVYRGPHRGPERRRLGARPGGRDGRGAAARGQPARPVRQLRGERADRRPAAPGAAAAGDPDGGAPARHGRRARAGVTRGGVPGGDRPARRLPARTVRERVLLEPPPRPHRHDVRRDARRARLDAADAAGQHRAAAARERRRAHRAPAAGRRGVAGPGHADRPGRPLPGRAGDAGRRRGGQRGRGAVEPARSPT